MRLAARSYLHPATLLVLTILGSLGCGQTILLTTELRAEAPAPTASFLIVEDGEGSPTVRRNVASSIRQGLNRRGFEVVTVAPADYTVFFEFGTKARRLFRPAEADYVESGWTHYLKIRVFDAGSLGQQTGTRPAWTGRTELEERHIRNPPNPQDTLDLMVASAFEYFPSSTRKAVKIPLLEARRIREGESSKAHQIAVTSGKTRYHREMKVRIASRAGKVQLFIGKRIGQPATRVIGKSPEWLTIRCAGMSHCIGSSKGKEFHADECLILALDSEGTELIISGEQLCRNLHPSYEQWELQLDLAQGTAVAMPPLQGVPATEDRAAAPSRPTSGVSLVPESFRQAVRANNPRP